MTDLFCSGLPIEVSEEDEKRELSLDCRMARRRGRGGRVAAGSISNPSIVVAILNALQTIVTVLLKKHFVKIDKKL